MKKIASLMLMLLLMFSVVGCGTEQTSNKSKVNVYIGGSDNVRANWEKFKEAFEAQDDSVDINIVYVASGTGGQSGVDRLLAAEKAGEKKVDIDIMDISDGDLIKIVKEAGEDALVTIDEKLVPNLKNVVAFPAVNAHKAMAYRGSTVVLAYNADAVKEVPKTVEDMYSYIKSHPQRFAYCEPGSGGSGDSFLVTSIYNKLPEEAIHSDDTKWQEQWNTGFDILKELHPYMYKTAGSIHYPFKNQGALDLLISGEIDMTPMWNDMLMEQKANGLVPESIMMTQLEPSFTGGLANVVIPSKSQQVKAAAKVLNFLSSPDGQEVFVSNMYAIPVIDTDLLNKDVVDKLAGLEVSKYRTYSIGELSTELKKKWHEKIATIE